MHSSGTYRHQGDDLQGSAGPFDAGRQTPQLIAGQQVWPRRPRVIAGRRGAHRTDATATGAARAQGNERILDCG